MRQRKAQPEASKPAGAAREKSGRHKPLQCRRGAAPGTTRAADGPAGDLAENSEQRDGRSRSRGPYQASHLERRRRRRGAEDGGLPRGAVRGVEHQLGRDPCCRREGGEDARSGRRPNRPADVARVQPLEASQVTRWKPGDRSIGSRSGRSFRPRSAEGDVEVGAKKATGPISRWTGRGTARTTALSTRFVHRVPDPALCAEPDPANALGAKHGRAAVVVLRSLRTIRLDQRTIFSCRPSS